MSVPNRCCAKIRADTIMYRTRQCGHAGRVQVDGQWYCGTHDPERLKRQREQNQVTHAQSRKYRRLTIAGPRIYTILKELVEGKKGARQEAEKLINDMENGTW